MLKLEHAVLATYTIYLADTAAYKQLRQDR